MDVFVALITVVTWNVNSVKARLSHLLTWLKETSPDVVLLQEIKTVDAAFPSDPISDLGYNIALNGQKTYNGVAILSKQPIEILRKSLPGNSSDQQSRYLEAFTAGLRVSSIYAPNGNPVKSEKFLYKIDWLERLYEHIRALLATDDACVLGGDYNVAPHDCDVHDPQKWRDDALCLADSRQAFRRIVYLGLTDALQAAAQEDGKTAQFTWWDYRGGAFAANEGLRIDHCLLSPHAADRLVRAGVDRTPRGWERPSDHAPVWCTFSAA